MPLPDDPHVRFAGMLPDEERLHALEAATVVVVPSPHESLSLLALEAFAVGTPVLANARAEVLVDHCRRSNAGLYYADRWEFIDALKLLMKDARTARGDGPERQGLRQSALSMEHDHPSSTSGCSRGSRVRGRTPTVSVSVSATVSPSASASGLASAGSRNAREDEIATNAADRAAIATAAGADRARERKTSDHGAPGVRP